MSRKRVTSWVLALVLGLTARTAIAAPQAWMTQLRAVTCCADHCPTRSARPMVPNRCCFVGSPAADPAASSGSTSLERPATTVLALTVPVAAAIVSVPTVLRGELAAVRAGPPTYLRSLSLRL